MSGRRFYKMTGSGNDFVFFDALHEPPGPLAEPSTISRLCARGTGVGADGVVFIQPATSVDADFRMKYFNSDGSPAEMCGNAALCSAWLASELGAAKASSMRFETDSGLVAARVVGGIPEIDLAPVTDVRADAGIPLEPGELRIGFARVGNPHVVVLRTELDTLDIVPRGRAIRFHETQKPGGTNANFVARRQDGRFDIRTYERGVEGETLACGTGSVASAILLAAWQQSGDESTLVTRSGLTITGRFRRDGDVPLPTLRGQCRLVFTGERADD